MAKIKKKYKRNNFYFSKNISSKIFIFSLIFFISTMAIIGGIFNNINIFFILVGLASFWVFVEKVSLLFAKFVFGKEL